MRNLDLSPLYRASIGFDQIAELMNRTLASDVSTSSYPPYNIEKIEDDTWRISIAVAGFSQSDLSIDLNDRSLNVSAKKAQDDDAKTYLHRGIANRAFERRFTLADHVNITGATHQDGMLHIDLTRNVPEALKPRKIQITNESDATFISDKSVN